LYADTLALDWILSAFGFLLSLLPFWAFDMAILLIGSPNAWLGASILLGCAFTETESSKMADTVHRKYRKGKAPVGQIEFKVTLAGK
jgi:hypothetical protein